MTFKVIANPWASIDAQARPTGRVPLVNDGEARPGKFVGAKLVANKIVERKMRKVGRYLEVTQDAVYDRVWEFSSSPVEVQAEGGRPALYYFERLREGSLIPADPACAVACGMEFIDPVVVIAKSKAARRTEFDAQHGSGAFDALQPGIVPVAPAQAPAPVTSETETPTTEPAKSTATSKRAASKE